MMPLCYSENEYNAILKAFIILYWLSMITNVHFGLEGDFVHGNNGHDCKMYILKFALTFIGFQIPR